MGLGERGRNGGTIWQKIVRCLASQENGTPQYQTLGPGKTQHAKRLQIYSRMGDGRGKGVRKPAEEQRGERGRQG